MHRILLILNTLKFLKLSQIFFLIKIRVLKTNLFYLNKSRFKKRLSEKKWVHDIPKNNSMLSKNTFIFLNKKKDICLEKDWNNKKLSKLWLYNLHYFDDLNSKIQSSYKNELRVKLVNQWIDNNTSFYGIGWEPYPTSIRIVNWIKWSFKGITLSEKIQQSLFSQSLFLSKNLEKHLLGNHIFTNAKALIFAGLFFDGSEADNFYYIGINIFTREIKEQILEDGAHFELSPMYHSVILEDLLDIKNIHNRYSKKLSINLENIIKKMLNWLNYLCHPDQKISFFNDAAFDIAPSKHDLINYTNKLELETINPSLKFKYFKSSGFVYYKKEDIYLIANIGKIVANYQPGHAHAGTFSFELSLFKERFIVNSGISTYENNSIRALERNTLSHSTVCVDNQNSTEIWSSFRVARRPEIFRKKVIHNDKSDTLNISASHDGYRHLKGKPIHTRDWFLKENKLTVTDQISGKGLHNIKIVFPLNPKVRIKNVTSNTIECLHKNKKIFFKFSGDGKIETMDSIFNYSFGLSEKNKKIIFNSNQYLPSAVTTEVIW